MNKLEVLKIDFEKSLKKFNEILNTPVSEITRDAALKRFEFTFDLAWKTLQAYLEENKGIVCKSPKECIREAYRLGIIDYDEKWLNIFDWRNQIVHEYSEDFAEELFEKLPDVLKIFEELLKRIV
jgi:nucleotidyltransferase substrate binding protein (TIGR01987 family)